MRVAAADFGFGPQARQARGVPEVVEALEARAEALRAAGVADERMAILRVPGAFEIPLAAKRAAATGAFDAVVCLGCLIRGATPHFDYIASAVAHGLTDAAAATGVPMAFGAAVEDSTMSTSANIGHASGYSTARPPSCSATSSTGSTKRSSCAGAIVV